MKKPKYQHYCEISSLCQNLFNKLRFFFFFIFFCTSFQVTFFFSFWAKFSLVQNSFRMIKIIRVFINNICTWRKLYFKKKRKLGFFSRFSRFDNDFWNFLMFLTLFFSHQLPNFFQNILRFLIQFYTFRIMATKEISLRMNDFKWS